MEDEEIDFSFQFFSQATDSLSVGLKISSDAISLLRGIPGLLEREIGALENSREIGVTKSKRSFWEAF